MALVIISTVCYGADVTNNDGILIITVTPPVDKTNLQGFEIRIYEGEYQLWDCKTPEITTYFDYADKVAIDPDKWHLPMTLTIRVWSLGSYWIDGYGFKTIKSTCYAGKTVEIQTNPDLLPVELNIQ